MKNQIFEALGVPENIIPSARLFYDDLMISIKNELENSEGEQDFSVVPSQDLKIGEYDVEEISVKITVIETDEVQEPEFISMGVGSTTKKGEKYPYKGKIITDITNPEFNMTIVVPEQWNVDEVLSYVKNNRAEIVSSISHEFKHLFDDQKRKWEIFKDRSRYHSGRDIIRFDIPKLDKFGYLIYFTHMIESLVRPTEMLAMLEENKISKRGFINFLKNNRVYKLLKESNEFSVEDLRSTMMEKHMDRVNEILDTLMIQGREQMSDQEKVDEVLNIFYINLVNTDLGVFRQLITSNFLENLFGFDENKQKVYDKHANYLRRFEKNPIDYFRFEERYMKMLSENIIKKIHKLYSLLPEDNFDSNMNIHKKISSRK